MIAGDSAVRDKETCSADGIDVGRPLRAGCRAEGCRLAPVFGRNDQGVMMRSTFRRLFRVGIALSLSFSLSPRLAESASTGAADAAPARKVLVVAKIQEEAKRRSLEEAARAQLKERGVETILGSDVMTEADFVSEDAVRKKVESLGVDGVIGYVPLRIEESVKTSSAHLSIGVGGYGGGGMGMFVGGSVPIGGSSKVVRKVSLRARYFAKPFAGPAWEKVYQGKLEDDPTWLIRHIAHESVTALKKKKFIPAK